MNSLKNALGKQSEKGDPTQNKLTSNRTFNKSKNASIWTLDEDEDENIEKVASGFNEQIFSDFSIAILNQVEKNEHFQQIFFYEILQKIQTENQYQDEAKSLQILHICSEKMIQKQETSEKAKIFLSQFVECVVKRAKRLKKKEKKNELQQFDKIVKNNFKKKSIPHYIEEQKLNKNEQDPLNSKAIRNLNMNERKNRSKSIGQGSSSKRNPSSSSEGKLGNLISRAVLKDEKKQQQNQENQQRQQNVSFSTVLSQTMVQRQRRPKDEKKDKKEKTIKNEEKKEKIEENEGNDEAFIFYRPKAGKKK